MKPHKHAELIKAWADGAEIEIWSSYKERWVQVPVPEWYIAETYRVKPELKPDYICYAHIYLIDGRIENSGFSVDQHLSDNICVVFDGETHTIKNIEVIK